MIARYWDKRHGIASVRPKKIAKFLIKKGHNVVVLVDNDSDRDSLFEIEGCLVVPCFPSNFSRNDKSKKETKSSPKSDSNAKPKHKSFIFKLKRTIKGLLWTIYKTYIVNNRAKKNANLAFKKLKKHNFKYDVIFSSYGPVDNHFLAYKFKKRQIKSVWIADFRDPIANVGFQNKKVYRFNLNIQTKITNHADLTTIVSETWKNEFMKAGSKNVRVLYSGFDKDDFLNYKKTTNNKLTFSYTGSLYRGLSDLSPFVDAIFDLVNEGIIKQDSVRINYAGPNSDVFCDQFNKLNSLVEINDYGFISRDKSLCLLFESDILLHSLFCYKGYNGIITGKMGEYWEAHKPVLCIVTGDEHPQEFISIFSKSKVGFLFDGTRQTSTNELKDYIKSQYVKKINHEDLIYDRNEQFINEFSYDNIITKLLSMIYENEDINNE